MALTIDQLLTYGCTEQTKVQRCTRTYIIPQSQPDQLTPLLFLSRAQFSTFCLSQNTSGLSTIILVSSVRNISVTWWSTIRVFRQLVFWAFIRIHNPTLRVSALNNHKNRLKLTFYLVEGWLVLNLVLARRRWCWFFKPKF